MKFTGSVNSIRNTRRHRWIVLLVGVGLLSDATAQEAPYHEFVPVKTIRQLSRGPLELVGPNSKPIDGEATPSARRPDAGRPTTAEYPLDLVARMPKSAVPDRRTQSDNALTYRAVFNPSIAPLKRYMVYDHIDDQYVLTTRPSKRTPIPVRTAASSGSDRRQFSAQFYAQPTPKGARMPSVSPDMNILEVVDHEGSALRFSRDEAGGYYVHGQGERIIHITLLVDAPQAYFGRGALPVDGLLGQFANHRDTQLNKSQRDKGRRVGAAIGLSSKRSFRDGIRLLTAYFRGFEAGSLEEKTDDPYLDIALGRKGVCRHRAFAFLVTARAFGVATRVVYNEAHAFVEVLMPVIGWRRIDLGGVAPSLTIIDGQNKVLDRAFADGLPTPETYRRSYSHALLGKTHADDIPGRPVLTGVPRRQDHGKVGLPTGRAPVVEDVNTAVQEVERPLKVEFIESKKRYVVDRSSRNAYGINGVVRDAESGRAVAGAMVSLFLTDSQGLRIPVGTTRAASDGRFQLTMVVPKETPAATYTMAVDAVIER